MILNIHGFSSSGLSKKSKILRKYFGEKILSPSLSYVPTLAADTIEQCIKTLLQHRQNVHLIGSSIGGYFAIYFAQKYDLKAVLINPAIYPYTFTAFEGLHENSFDNSRFESLHEHIVSLKKYEVKKIKNPKNFLVLLQKGDELLDYKEAAKKFENSNQIIEEGGNHGFENFSSKLKIIENFLNS